MTNKTYNEEMFDYLTQPDNYNSALELTETLSIVDQNLREQFWQEVTQRLKSKVEEYQHSKSINLEFKKKGDIENCKWFQIKKDDWEFYFISTDGEDVGITIRAGKQAELKCKEELIKNEIESQQLNVGNYGNIGWICWKTFSNYRFQTKEEKPKILPISRGTEISTCANEVFSYLEKLIDICDSVNRKISESR